MNSVDGLLSCGPKRCREIVLDLASRVPLDTFRCPHNKYVSFKEINVVLECNGGSQFREEAVLAVGSVPRT